MLFSRPNFSEGFGLYALSLITVQKGFEKAIKLLFAEKSKREVFSKGQAIARSLASRNSNALKSWHLKDDNKVKRGQNSYRLRQDFNHCITSLR